MTLTGCVAYPVRLRAAWDTLRCGDTGTKDTRPQEKADSSAGKGGSYLKVDKIVEQAKEWLDKDVRLVTNKNGDKVFMSNDAAKRLRFDINNTSPHNNPHDHVEVFVDGKWIKSGSIYPIDVPHN